MTTGEFLLYTTEDGVAKLEVRMVDETVWLSLDQMAELFQRDKSVISRHIKNIFEEGELAPRVSCCKFCNNCRGRERPIAGRPLQPRRDHLRRLPGQVPSRHPVPHLGDPAAAGIHRQGLRPGRRTPQAGRRRQLLRRAAGPHPRHPVVAKRSSGARCSTSTPPASTTTPVRRLPSASSPPCRTRCTGPPTATPPPRSFTNVPTPPSRTWA